MNDPAGVKAMAEQGMSYLTFGVFSESLQEHACLLHGLSPLQQAFRCNIGIPSGEPPWCIDGDSQCGDAPRSPEGHHGDLMAWVVLGQLLGVLWHGLVDRLDTWAPQAALGQVQG